MKSMISKTISFTALIFQVRKTMSAGLFKRQTMKQHCHCLESRCPGGYLPVSP